MYRQLLFVFFIILTLTLCLFASVDLVNFELIYDDDQGVVNINWQVSSESGVAAFHVYRSGSDASKGDLAAEVSAVPAPFGTGYYSTTDEPDSTANYYYKLVEINSLGEEVDIFKPSDDGNEDPDYIYFIKTFQQEQAVTAGAWVVFNQAEGDGHSVRISAESSDVGIVSVKQFNTPIDFAPGRNQLSVYWHIQTSTLDTLELEFSFNQADAVDMQYPGLAAFDSTTKTWQWLGGSYDAFENVITIQTNVFHFFVPMGRHMCDFNLDNQVNLADLQTLGDHFNSMSTGHFTTDSPQAFFNYNQQPIGSSQIIDHQDVNVFADEFK